VSPPARITAGRVLYWLAVLIVALALVVGLVLFFESRDASEIGAILLR
jgi:hypothetical protein